MKKKLKNDVYHNLKGLFPINYRDNNLVGLLRIGQSVLNKKINRINGPRILDTKSKNSEDIIKEFSNLPEYGDESNMAYKNIVSNFFVNIPRWRHPRLQYNVGTAVNSAACALYALALDENIYNINDGLAGNSLLAERAVSNILSDLAGLDQQSIGLFTFGGTATNYYATKIGLKKACPNSGKKGTPKNIRVFVTEDAHFSHTVSADWLGIGTDNVVVIKPNQNRTSDIRDAEKKMRSELNNGNIISSIILNGGTTYGHVVDDVLSFVKLRDKLVKEFSLSYTPHIHFDSVIGWAWLAFKDYNFVNNELGINKVSLKNIQEQYRRISQVKYADSWGADFHKGVGGCPVNCSIVMINNIDDLNFISKKKDSTIGMHQVAPEFSLNSPADYTLETSRSGGAPLAALASLHTLGKKGLQRNLANLIEQSIYTKKLISSRNDMTICHKAESYGFVTMARLYPPKLVNDKRRDIEMKSSSKKVLEFVGEINSYMKEFFIWDHNNRMAKGVGVEYSFSSGYMRLKQGVKISGIKLYPVSPHFNEKYAKKAVEDIVRQKKYFDKYIWKTKNK
ncbi:MAG: pyridoxal-dependent decarboxylase [Patescibacteria group bacterium]|nr:pyridoxal-dependent decarboxylase [Patescibacteria group bacterium]